MGQKCSCRKGQKNVNHLDLSKRGARVENKVYAIVRGQALIRGFLARRRVKKVYGFEMTRGLLHGYDSEIDAEKLEEQRQRVRAIREQLLDFVYELYGNEGGFEPSI